MFEEIKKFAIEQVLWAEKNLKDSNGQLKREAVIKKLDDMIKLPAYLEWLDNAIIGAIVDKACAKLNEYAGHDFGNAELSQEQEIELAQGIEDPKEK